MKRLLLTIAVLAVSGLIVALMLGDDPADESSTVYHARPVGTLTFNGEIAPIIFRECVACHRPGESAPFELLTYRAVRRHAAQIVDVTTSGFMPPWLPEADGRAFVGERRLTPDEIGMLRQWVEEGAHEGRPADLLAPPVFVEGWRLGEPDLVLELARPYTLAAEGEDVFRNFVYPTGLRQTRYVRALEFRAASPRAVHHATIAVDRTHGSRFHDQRESEPGFDGMINSSAERPDGHMLGWVPGKLPHEVPAEIVWPLERETDLIVQLHLQPTGKTESIHPRIGLYFAETPPSRTALMIRLGPRTLDIPADAGQYTAEDSFVLPVDVELLGLLPHAHYLARRMLGYAVLPDGVREPLIRIEDWDFNWQDEYRLAEPLWLPKGSTLFMQYTFDNTEGNVRNPRDPPTRVVFGPKTTDEMGDLWLQVLPRNARDREILEREFLRKEAGANRACYEKMLELDPNDVTVRYEFGELLQREGRLEAAIPQFERVLQIDADHVPANAALGRALLASGRGAEASARFRAALVRMPELAEVHFNLGQALKIEGRLDEAIEEYRVALELQDDLVAAYHSMAEVLRARGEVDQALAYLRTALEYDPAYAPSQNNLGSILAARGEMRQAEEHFTLALRSDPGYAQAHNNLGMVLVSRGMLDQAIVHFRRAVELRPDHEPSQRNLAIALRKQHAPQARSAQPNDSAR